MKIPKYKWSVVYDRYGHGVFDAVHITVNRREDARDAAKDWYRFLNHGSKHLDIPHRKVKIVKYKLS